jgi:hypothetical protein
MRSAVMNVGARGEPPMTIYNDTVPACRECDIVLTPEGSFGGLHDEILLQSIPIVERDSRGFFYAIVPLWRNHELIVYAPDGRIERTIGRRGSGPGEFAIATVDHFVGRGDTLYVAHDRNRLSVFDSAGKWIRSVQLEPPGDQEKRIVAVSKDSYVLNVGHQRPDLVGRPLHIYDRAGKHQRAFGPYGLAAASALSDAGRKLGLGVSVTRHAAVASDGSYWLLEGAVYRLEHVDSTGRIIRVIGVESPQDWRGELFMTPEEYVLHFEQSVRVAQPASPDRGAPRQTERRSRAAPRMKIGGIAFTGRDLLVVAVHVAAVDWDKVVVKLDTTRFREQSVPEPGYYQKRHDTILDVIDLRTGEVLARKRVSGTAYLTRGGDLYIPSTTEDGVINVKAFDIEFVRR